MKKNLLSIIILALLVVNIVLTSVMMFSVMSTSGKTAKLVTDIASVLQLELTPAGGEEQEQETVSIENTDVYEIKEMMVLMKSGEDGKDHYAQISVNLSMNTKDKGYKKYGAEMETKESLIKSEIGAVFANYTVEEAKADPDGGPIREEILARLQKLFDSEFIYDVTFSSILYQ